MLNPKKERGKGGLSIQLPRALVKKFHAQIDKERRDQFIALALQKALHHEEKWQTFRTFQSLEAFEGQKKSSFRLDPARQEKIKQWLG